MDAGSKSFKKRRSFHTKQRKENRKANQRGCENEKLEMHSTSKLVEDLMKRDGLTVDLMAEKTGKPVEYFIEIIRRVRDVDAKDAFLFQRCFGWSARELLDHQCRDVMARFTASTRILEVWAQLFKQELKWREVEAEIKEFLAQIGCLHLLETK